MTEGMSSESERQTRFGDYIEHVNFQKYDHLLEVEAFFLEEMQKYPTSACYDLGASEHPYFDNVNYTNFSDFFMMRPLQPELANIQTEEALIYGSTEPDFDFYITYADRLTRDNLNKYTTEGRSVKHCKAVVVLLGTNMLDRLCKKKLQLIYREHGTLAVYKPHPLTHFSETSVEAFIKSGVHKHITVADKDEDVYAYIKDAEVVYTTHCSETVFHATCLGKRVEPIDKFNERINGSYNHINKHLFETDNPKYIINKMFNDYRSGLVHPTYQPDWKERISQYLDYIHKKRSNYRTRYL